MSLAIVQQVRSRYPTPMSPEQAVKACNEVAYALNGQTGAGPWGLHRKGGSSWNGLALDIIVATGVGYDIFSDVEGAGAPAWGVAAVPPGGWQWEPVHLDWLPSGQVEPPPVTPPPVDPPGDCCAQLLAKLDAVLAEVAALKRMAVEIGSQVQTTGLRVRLW